MKNCTDCGRPWIELSRDMEGEKTVKRVMAAHDCDGVGVLASWFHTGESWEMWETTMEEGVERTGTDYECPPLVEIGCISTGGRSR